MNSREDEWTNENEVKDSSHLPDSLSKSYKKLENAVEHAVESGVDTLDHVITDLEKAGGKLMIDWHWIVGAIMASSAAIISNLGLINN